MYRTFVRSFVKASNAAGGFTKGECQHEPQAGHSYDRLIEQYSRVYLALHLKCSYRSRSYRSLVQREGVCLNSCHGIVYTVAVF